MFLMETFRFLLLCCYLISWRIDSVRAETSTPFGSCSKRCGNESTAVTSELLFNCSCASSCAAKGDCCYDAAARAEVNHQGPTILTLNETKYVAVNTCPSDFNSLSLSCSGNIGILPPVTSRKTGTTYLNFYCALCNTDNEDSIPWDATLRCCDENSESKKDGVRYLYRRGSIWRRDLSMIRGRPTMCRCQYIGDKMLIDSLEQVSRAPIPGVSKCSPTWADKETASLCSSYVDPVYFGDKMYRNRHCAVCHYLQLDRAKCWPRVVDEMLSRGNSVSDIFRTCESRHLAPCVNFFLQRGRAYAIQDLFNIHKKECVPPPNRRCCRGQRYHFKTKRCRKLAP